MDLSELLAAEAIKPVELARRVGCSKSHLSHVLAGRKALGRPLAIRIWRETGRKVGPIAGASDAEIAVLERFQGAA